jgi:hypothetical protein
MWCQVSIQKLRFTPTNRQKLEAQKTCDIIHPVSLVSGADFYLYKIKPVA